MRGRDNHGLLPVANPIPSRADAIMAGFKSGRAWQHVSDHDPAKAALPVDVLDMRWYPWRGTEIARACEG